MARQSLIVIGPLSIPPPTHPALYPSTTPPAPSPPATLSSPPGTVAPDSSSSSSPTRTCRRSPLQPLCRQTKACRPSSWSPSPAFLVRPTFTGCCYLQRQSSRDYCVSFPPIAFVHLHQQSSSSSLSPSASYLTRSAALPAPRPPIARSPSPSPASTPSRTAVLPHVLASRCPSHPAPCVSHASIRIAWRTKPHGSRRALFAPQRLPRLTTLGALRQWGSCPSELGLSPRRAPPRTPSPCRRPRRLGTGPAGPPLPSVLRCGRRASSTCCRWGCRARAVASSRPLTPWAALLSLTSRIGCDARTVCLSTHVILTIRSAPSHWSQSALCPPGRPPLSITPTVPTSSHSLQWVGERTDMLQLAFVKQAVGCRIQFPILFYGCYHCISSYSNKRGLVVE